MSASSCTPPNPNFIEATKQFLMAMPIAQHFGFDITDVTPGRFEITRPFRRELSFREGVFQAGPIGTLADMAAACAGATMLPDGWAASTVDYTLKLLAPAVGDKLIARGRVLRSGRTLSVAAPAPSNHPKQRIITHGQHKSAGKTRRWATTQGNAKVMDDQIEPRRSPRPRRHIAVIEALGENTSTAQNSVAAEAARHDHKPNLPPASGRSVRRR
jgi:uncharacterized protein (TIGR00369 family)